MTLVVGTNSYISAANSDTYFSVSLRAETWDGYDTELKEKALITATRMMDRQTWQGAKTSSGQALEWPRSGVYDKYGNSVDSASVPVAITNATCELAFSLLSDPAVETNSNTSKNIKSVKAGPTGVSYFRPTRGGRFPTIIQELIGQYLGSYGGISAPAVTGNDGESSFDCSPYTVNGGV